MTLGVFLLLPKCSEIYLQLLLKRVKITALPLIYTEYIIFDSFSQLESEVVACICF